jgi:hypothetical protein
MKKKTLVSADVVLLLAGEEGNIGFTIEAISNGVDL